MRWCFLGAPWRGQLSGTSPKHPGPSPLGSSPPRVVLPSGLPSFCCPGGRLLGSANRTVASPLWFPFLPGREAQVGVGARIDLHRSPGPSYGRCAPGLPICGVTGAADADTPAAHLLFILRIILNADLQTLWREAADQAGFWSRATGTPPGKTRPPSPTRLLSNPGAFNHREAAPVPWRDWSGRGLGPAIAKKPAAMFSGVLRSFAVWEFLRGTTSSPPAVSTNYS